MTTSRYHTLKAIGGKITRHLHPHISRLQSGVTCSAGGNDAIVWPTKDVLEFSARLLNEIALQSDLDLEWFTHKGRILKRENGKFKGVNGIWLQSSHDDVFYLYNGSLAPFSLMNTRTFIFDGRKVKLKSGLLVPIWSGMNLDFTRKVTIQEQQLEYQKLKADISRSLLKTKELTTP